MLRSETAILLIDNNCNDLDIKSITEIVKNNFESVKYILINGATVPIDLFENYLPIDTSSNYLNLSDFKWSEVCEYSDLVFITDKESTQKEINILAFLYRIVTGKTIYLIKNGPLSLYYSNPMGFFEYYPFFLTVFSTKTCQKYEWPEIEFIDNRLCEDDLIDDLSMYKSNVLAKLKSIESLNEKPRNEFNEGKVNFKEYFELFNYILNNGQDWKKSFFDQEFSNSLEKQFIERLAEKVSNIHLNETEFKFYDAEHALHPSLANKLQVSIPTATDSQLIVYKTDAGDFNFRNLKLKNVLINVDSGAPIFVLPFYKNDQATRQTVRFLIMYLYHVNNNSALVDLIVLYLFMKVSNLEDKLIRTRYENIARLFLKRHGKESEAFLKFLESNRSSILSLKKHFKELENFDDDEDLFDLFDDFVRHDFKLNNSYEFIKPFEVVYRNESDIKLNGLNENKLDVFEFSEKIKQQDNVIEIMQENWPSSQNFQCDDKKLQFNSSLPFFICVKSYQEFLERIDGIEWMKKIAKLTDKLVLKGGALLDILVDRKPKDYDFMNIGMSNDELLEFMRKLIKDLKPKLVTFVPSPVTLFRVTLENDELIEIVANTETSQEKLFSESYLPDQLCYMPSTRKLYANEYTLWALNYGYCELVLEKHPKSMRLSKKLNKLGFNFFYREEFKNKTKFLKERLERYVWSICQSTLSKTPSYTTRDREKEEESAEKNVCKIEKKRIIVDEKIVFSCKESFVNYIKEQVEKKSSNDSDAKIIHFKGAIILSDKKAMSNYLSTGLDWSF